LGGARRALKFRKKELREWRDQKGHWPYLVSNRRDEKETHEPDRSRVDTSETGGRTGLQKTRPTLSLNIKVSNQELELY